MAKVVSWINFRRTSERQPVRTVLAQEQRDGRGPPKVRDSRCLRGGRRGEARPASLSGEAQHVEHRSVVLFQSRRKNRALPCAGRQLETVEGGKDRAQTIDPGQLVPQVDVLPDEQEPHE